MQAQPYSPAVGAIFCEILAQTGIVGRAADAAGIKRDVVYRWRKDQPAFATAWDAALEVGLTALEDEVKRRGFEGVEKPITHQGQLTPVWEYNTDGSVVTEVVIDPDTGEPRTYKDGDRERVERRPRQARNPDGSLKWLTVREFSDSLAKFVLERRMKEYQLTENLNLSGNISIGQALAAARRRSKPTDPDEVV